MSRPDDQHMRGDQTASAVASPLALGFAGLGGMTAWAVHFWTVYSLVEIACRTDFPGFAAVGLSGLQLLLTVATLVAGVVALAAAMVSFRINRRADVGIATDRDGPRALAAFMGQSGLLLSGLFLLAIVMAAIPAFVVPPCG